jgi:site-specific recombinase XerD
MRKKTDINRMNVVSYAEKVGLPTTFRHLTIQGLTKVVNSNEITEKNKELIFKFLNHISPEVGERRLTFYTHKLRRLAFLLKKDFDHVEEEDLRSLLTYLSKGNAREDGGNYSNGTLHGYRVTIKRFYRWLEGEDEEYPRKVRWIKTSGDTTRIHEPEQLLTFDEVHEMIRHARKPRDKAIIAFLYESGARISEMLSMKIRHLEFTVTMAKATLPVSKTRPRVIPLVSCKNYLSVWVNYHPLKDDPEAPLWSCMRGDGSKALINHNVNGLLKSIASSAGIRKRVYPHLFRACSITHKQMAGWPEQAIKVFHGLCKDSKVMKHYSHLSYSNLEDIQKKMNGLPVENRNNINQGVKCPSCGKRNPLYVDICVCGLPTEVKYAPGNQDTLETEIQKRLDKTMENFIESRSVYDNMMERFLEALSRKAKHSPNIMNAIDEISREIRGKSTWRMNEGGRNG